MTEQKAIKFITAFAAWEYSHCVLSISQLAGATVQLLVALFAGYVQMKKMTAELAMHRKASAASQKGAQRPRSIIARTRFAPTAGIKTKPKSAHPR